MVVVVDLVLVLVDVLRRRFIGLLESVVVPELVSESVFVSIDPLDPVVPVSVPVSPVRLCVDPDALSPEMLPDRRDFRCEPRPTSLSLDPVPPVPVVPLEISVSRPGVRVPEVPVPMLGSVEGEPEVLLPYVPVLVPVSMPVVEPLALEPGVVVGDPISVEVPVLPDILPLEPPVPYVPVVVPDGVLPVVPVAWLSVEPVAWLSVAPLLVPVVPAVEPPNIPGDELLPGFEFWELSLTPVLGLLAS